MFGSHTQGLNDSCTILPSQPSQDLENALSSAFVNPPSNPTRKRKYVEVSKHVDGRKSFIIQVRAILEMLIRMSTDHV